MLGKSISAKVISIPSAIMAFIVVLSLGAVGKANIPLRKSEPIQEPLRQTTTEYSTVMPNAYMYSYQYANAERINYTMGKKNPKGYYAKPPAEIKSDSSGFSYAPQYVRTPR